MKTIEEYQIVNGTAYNKNANELLINILERSRLNKERLIFDFGNTEIGESWGETFDTTGHVGRSTGSIQIPLLIKTKRSYGGGALLDGSIVAIYTSKGKNLIYKHKNYKPFNK